MIQCCVVVADHIPYILTIIIFAARYGVRFYSKNQIL